MATQAWQAEAEAHFRKISVESFIAFPSGRNNVPVWDFSDPDQLTLLVRWPLSSDMRLKVRTGRVRDTWRGAKATLKMAKALVTQVAACLAGIPPDQPKPVPGNCQDEQDQYTKPQIAQILMG